MKKLFLSVPLLALALSMPFNGYAASAGAQAQTLAVENSANQGAVVINGTGQSIEVPVTAANLVEDVTLTATPGFKVFPTKLSAESANGTQVMVTLTSSLAKTNGQLILRSGDMRAYVNLVGYGTPLEMKDLSTNPVYGGGADATFENSEADGFTPGENGYTVEFRVKTNNASQAFDAYAITSDDAGFKAYVTSNEIGLYDGPDRKVSIANPATSAAGGLKSFYNNDGRYHTYRYAVTSDHRVFIYRDGLPVDTLRANDFGHQPDWAVENGGVVENLLKNPGFEGEHGGTVSGTIREVEGWQLNPFDQYNCSYFVVNQEIDNELDFNNHVMQLNRYTWNDGWGAGTVSQIVDVAPNETYSLTFLARGGMKTKDDAIDEIMASVRIQEVQDTDLGTSVDIENMGDFEEYSMSYTTTAECKQVKVTLYQERFLNGGGWGSSMEPFEVDEMQLTGMSRSLAQKVGFESESADVEYFTYDATGAYAPPVVEIVPSLSDVVIDGTGETEILNIASTGLVADEQITLTATGGFSVFPETLTPNTASDVMITLESSEALSKGQLIIRSGDVRQYVKLTGYGSELEQKDLSQNPVYTGSDAASKWNNENGFVPGENGYTVEFRVKTNNAAQAFDAYAITKDDAGFRTFVGPNEISIYDGPDRKVSLSNPATKGEGGLGTFYNNDGRYHTYRYAVTPDHRIFIYRDGLPIDTLRANDFGHQPEWAVENGGVVENLLKNPGFEKAFGDTISGTVREVEGWQLNPFDQYNCQYFVANQEINNELDFNNHVMQLKRYTWNDGWGAGTVSQIVDVAPNETYSLTFLARGGMKTKDDAIDEIMASVRIQEVQDTDLGTSVDIENMGDFEEYSMSYTTTAECKQVKVTLYQERFLNGGGWGSSMEPFEVDEMQLTGMSRSLDEVAGFDNQSADIEYFTYDTTGAYAPLLGNLSDVEDAVANANLSWTVNDNQLVLMGAEEGTAVKVYDSMGLLLYATDSYVSGEPIQLNGTSVIICEAVCNGQRQVFKAINK